MNASSKLTARGNSLAVTLPRDVIEAAGLTQGDELTLTVRDSVIEIRHAAPVETALNEAFEWSLGRYAQTYRDLAK
jgi:putative addiction module antidote